jgi:hypothetical protein
VGIESTSNRGGVSSVTLTGTSQAAPIVAGLAAILRQVWAVQRSCVCLCTSALHMRVLLYEPHMRFVLCLQFAFASAFRCHWAGGTGRAARGPGPPYVRTCGAPARARSRCALPHIHTYIHNHTYTHMYTHNHTYTHIYKYTHAATCRSTLGRHRRMCCAFCSAGRTPTCCVAISLERPTCLSEKTASGHLPRCVRCLLCRSAGFAVTAADTDIALACSCGSCSEREL